MTKLFSTWKSYSLIILSCCYFESAFAQPLREQNQKPLEAEKVHLHFDKPFYSAGDTLWFKAYLVNAANELTEHSKVLYVDLINESDLLIKSVKVPLAAGLGWADIPLDKKLPGGNYRIRAYTNWLRNFGEEYFFQKIIPVSDVFQTQVAGNISYSYTGGQLIADLAYSSLDGTPLSDKEIRYMIPKNERRTISGRGKTDADGRLRISIDTTDLGEARSLTARIEIEADTLFKTFSIPANSSIFDVQFFPEGGKLINNIPSRIGFKVVGSGGFGLKAKGYISDQLNTRIVSFDTEFAGMGMFGFNPQPGGKYIAHVKLEDGTERQFSLPGALDRGYIMTVSEDENHVLVKIRSDGLAKNSPITLQASSQGKVYVNSRNSLADEQLIIKILKDDLPTGISRLTLLSNGEDPLAERLVFIDRTDELSISLDSLQDSYFVRSKVSPKVRVTDQLGKPVLAHLSLSVVDESKVPYNEYDELTILSNLLLTSELKGHIEQPNYYFTDRDEDKKRQLDILMMTQGWRRFEWKSAESELTTESIFPPEQFLSVSGRVVTALNSPISNGLVNLTIPGEQALQRSTFTNEQGEFSFDTLDYEGQVKVILTAKNEKQRANINIVLDSIPSQEISPSKHYIPALINHIDSSVVAAADDSYLIEMKRIVDLNKALLLDEVKVTAPRKRKVEESVNINGSEAQYVLLEKDFQTAISLSHGLSGKIPSLTANKKVAFYRDSRMAIYIDGAPMDQDMWVDDINVNDVAGIEILSGNQAALYGKGAILFVTFKSGMPKPPGPQLGTKYQLAEGYAPERIFYSPKYDDPTATYPKDFRSTIYWNPNILTNNGENSDITFFTAEKPGTYRFIIEGIDEYGRLGRKVLTKQIK